MWVSQDIYTSAEQTLGQHNIIINLTFCGDWAGGVFVGYDGATGLAACNGKYIHLNDMNI
jgi:hypothetical protein